MSKIKEILILEGIVCICFWISNEYLATLLTFIAVPIFESILIISIISEKIERSKISKDYFFLMAGLAFIPAIIFLIFYFIKAGELMWLES